MKRLLIGIACVATTLSAASADDTSSVKILALAKDRVLTVLVGKYDPAHGWISNEKFYDDPPQGAPFTLFGLTGKIAEVRSIQEEKLPACGVPWAWSVNISSYPQQVQDESLAIRGRWPAPARVATMIPLDDSTAIKIVADYLKTKHLDVPAPRLTQALRVDLAGDGREEWLLTAQSQDVDLTASVSVPQYAVALVRVGETTVPAASYAELKPAGRSTEQQERFYGKRPHNRWVAVLDLNDDGKMEIVLRQRFEFEPHVDIFSLDGQRLKTVLTSYIVEDP